jgi:hypothetical protein
MIPMKNNHCKASLAILILIGCFCQVAVAQQKISSIPSPTDFLGFSPGEDYRLANYEEIVSYFQLLDKLSSRIRLQELGKTTEGRPFFLAIISSADNLQKTAQIIDTQQRLADPRTIIDAEARRLIREAKVIVSINCSIHPREIGPSQMSMELAYQLVSIFSRDIEVLLDNVVLLLIPAHNPDGLDRVVDWYKQRKGSEYEAGPLPALDHTYAGHDLNRDWFALTQNETRLTTQEVFNVWRPHIVFDLHQMGSFGARMFVPPFADPYDPMMEPVIQADLAFIGTAIAADLTAQGNSGVAFNVYFDSFSPARNYVNYHGGVRVLGEIASARLASPLNITPEILKPTGDFDPRVRSWNQPLPWKGTVWRLGDIVDYSLNASYSILKNATRNRELWLNNAYNLAKESAIPTDEKPTFLIPPKQHDLYATYELLNLLRIGLVEFYWAKHDFVIDDTLYPKGTIIIPSAQPYCSYVRSLLETIPYPEKFDQDQGKPLPPFDVTTHNLPLLFGVKVVPVKGSINADLEKVTKLSVPSGSIKGQSRGYGFLVDFRSNQAIKGLQRLYKEPSNLYWLADSVTADGEKLPPGTIYIKSNRIDPIQSIADEFSLRVWPSPELRGVRALQLFKPRVGLYQSWLAPIDEGWTRFLFDTFGIEYAILKDVDIRTTNLAEQFDVIILPDQSAEKIIKGAKEDTLPLEYCGGIGQNGVEQLRHFVESGGTLVTLNQASEVPLSYFWLQAKNVVKGMNPSDYYAPGSLLKILINTSTPLGYGMPREAAAFNENSPAFDLGEGQRIATYPGENLLLSGWLIGERYLSLKTAVAELPIGRGSVVLLGLRPQFRAQTRGTYKLLFNAIIKSSAKPAIVP